jgi:predicted nucleic acid-binding Zn ribbon protein
MRGNAQADRELLAMAMTFSNGPLAMNMTLQRDYAERYDWLVTQFQDLAFTLASSHLYYTDKDVADETTLEIYRQGISAFGGIAPTYHIALYNDGPLIVWDFHSLLRGIQMMFSFALTDRARPLRICPQCGMAFAASQPNAAFCSPECKNRFNVGKNRDKKKNGGGE